MPPKLQFVVKYHQRSIPIGMAQRMSDMLELVVMFSGFLFQCKLNVLRITTS